MPAFQRWGLAHFPNNFVEKDHPESRRILNSVTLHETPGQSYGEKEDWGVLGQEDKHGNKDMSECGPIGPFIPNFTKNSFQKETLISIIWDGQ